MVILSKVWATIRYWGTETFKWTTPKSSQGSTVPYIVGLAEYLANKIPIINSSLELFFKRFRKNTFITKSANVLPIWQRNNAVRSPVNSHQYTLIKSTVPSAEPIVSNSTFDDLSFGSGESLVDTTLSILKMLLPLFYYFRFNWWSCYYS